MITPDRAAVLSILEAAQRAGLGHVILIGLSPDGRVFVQTSLEYWDQINDLLDGGRNKLSGWYA